MKNRARAAHLVLKPTMIAAEQKTSVKTVALSDSGEEIPSGSGKVLSFEEKLINLLQPWGKIIRTLVRTLMTNIPRSLEVFMINPFSSTSLIHTFNTSLYLHFLHWNVKISYTIRQILTKN